MTTAARPASAAAGRYSQGCVTAQPCAVAAQRTSGAQGRTGTIGVPGPRAEPTITEHTTLTSGIGSWEWVGPPGRPAQLDYLQMRQQSLAGMALQEARVVLRQQVTEQTRLGFAQVTGWPASIQRLDPVSCKQPQAAEVPDPEHTYGGPPGRRCCTFLLYSPFEPFELRF